MQFKTRLFLFLAILTFGMSFSAPAQNLDTLYLINGDTIIGDIYSENRFITKIKVDTGWVFIQHSELLKPRVIDYVESPKPVQNEALSYTLPAGEFLMIKTNRRLTTRFAKSGEYFEGRTVQRISDENGRVILPENTPVIGRVKHSKSGKAFRKAQLQIELVSLDFRGEILPIRTNDNITIVNNYTAERILGSATSGSLIGGIFFDEWLEGALYGAAAGTVVSLFVENNNIVIPENSTLQFMLDTPVVIQ